MKTIEKLNRLMNPTCVEDWGLTVSLNDLIEDSEEGKEFVAGFLQSFVPVTKWPESLIKKLANTKHGKE